MPNIIKLKLSSVAAKAPLAADLIPGELAINVTDQILYSKDISGAIINVTGAPTSGSPNYIQNQSATTQAGTFKIASEGTVGQQLSVIGNGSTSTWNSLITLTAALPLRATGISIQNNNSWWLGTTYPSGLFQLRYKTGNWTSSTVRSDGTSDSNLMMSFDTAGAASFTSTIQATTAKLTNLTDGYIPYHISDASGLSNSPVYTDGTNVGIGTISLGAKFEVDGMTLARVTNFNSTHANGIYSTWSNSGSIIGDLGSGKSVVTGNFSDFALNVRGANNLVFGINSVEKVRINSSGNLGIGTTSPSQKLEVNSSTEIKGYFHGTHGGSQGIRVQRDFGDSVDLMANYTGWGGGLASSSALRFSVNGAGINGTPAMYINTIGNVGIDTTNPTQQLEITKNFRLPSTVGTTPYGIIYKGTLPFIHDFNYGNNGTVTTGGGNTFVGIDSGNLTMGSTATAVYEGSQNTAIGYQALNSNTKGYQNTAIGYQALNSNTIGYQNTANGHQVLNSNTIGYKNAANGYASLYYNTIGSENTANGAYSLYSNTTGNSNVAVGYTSLGSNTTGYNNTALGYSSGYNIADGITKRTTGNNGLYLGYDSRASVNGTNNEIVIGASAIGQGSNTVVLGNTSITKTVLNGNVVIDTISPFTVGGTAKLSLYTSTSNEPFTFGNTNSDALYFRRYGVGNYQLQTSTGSNAGNISLQSYGGNILIGTTTDNAVDKLQVNGTVTHSPATLSNQSATLGQVNSAVGAYLPLAGGTMANTNLVTNLNADLLDGHHASAFPNILYGSYTPAGAGWYKLAHTNSGDHGMMIITLYGYSSSNHSSSKFIVSNNHGFTNITQIMGSVYGGTGEVSSVRTMYNSTNKTYNGCAFEVYFTSTYGINYSIENITIGQSYNEWVISTGVTAAPWVQDKILENISLRALQTTTDIYSDNYRVWHLGNLTQATTDNWTTAYNWGNHSGLYSLLTHTHAGTYDNYVSWNLKTNGVQRTGMASGSSLDIVAGTNMSATYSAGGVVTITNSSPNIVQTSIVGITGTKAEFDTAVTNGNFMYIGDAPTAHTHTFASLTSKPTTLDGYGITDAASKLYVHSRGENLVTNGTAFLGDNTNFSAFTFDGSNANFSPGSFKFISAGTVYTDELMPVDVSKRYIMSVDAKSLNGLGRYYLMTVEYDVDNLVINAPHHMYRANTQTTLAQDLKTGDTVMYLTNAVNWDNSGTAGVSTHLRSIILWNYSNSFGYLYPPQTYSRNWLGNAWDPGSINFINNTVTLRVPWAAGLVPAGTPLSNGSSGGTYKYNVLSDTILNTNWTTYTGFMDGVDFSGTNISTKFSPATAKIKLGWLMNYGGSGETAWFTNLSASIDQKFQNTFTSTVATGTAPLTIASTTVVTNLNADLLDGQHGNYYAPATGGSYVPLVIAQGWETAITNNIVGFNSSATDSPIPSSTAFGFTQRLEGDGAYSGAFAMRGNRAFFQTKETNVLQGWNEFYHTGNLNNLNQLTTRNYSDLQNKPTTISGYGITDLIVYQNIDNNFSVGQTINGLENVAIAENTCKVNGFGFMSNRSTNLYFTNSHTSGGLWFGLGGIHGTGQKLLIVPTLATFSVPVTSTGTVTALGGNSTQWNTAYTHSQVTHQAIINGTGFVKASGTTISYDNSAYAKQIITISNGAGLNTIGTSGFYRIANIPTDDTPSTSAFGQMFVSRGDDTIAQVVIPYQNTDMYFRGANQASIEGIPAGKVWRKVWHDGNFTNLNQLTTRNFSDLQNKPTTISGYGITDPVIYKDLENAYTQQQYFEIATLTYATTINWNCRTAQKAKVTLTGNASIANPTLVKDGATYTLRITQDSIGGRILTWGANFNWGDASAPVLSTAPNKTDILSFEGDGTNLLFLGIRKGF